MQNMDRRAFVRNAALGAATVLGAGALAGCSQNEPAPANEPTQPAEQTTPAPADSTPAAAPKNRVCELLGIEKPVFSAPMFSLTDGTFVAAVSEAGGCGVLNGYALSTEEIWASPEETFRLLKQEMTKIRELTDKPFGVALPFSDIPGLKEFVLDIKPSIIIPGSFGQEDIYDFRDAGIKIFGSLYMGDLDVMKQQMAECDIAYLKCYGCGGTVPHNRANALTVLESVVAAGLTDTPLAIAGGIVNGVGASAMAAAGADSVWVGTRFLATNENPMSDVAKQMLLALKSSEMVEIDFGTSYSETNASPLALELIEKWKQGEEIQDPLGQYTFGMRGGDMDNWYLSVDSSVDCINELTSVKDVVDELGDAFLATQAQIAQ